MLSLWPLTKVQITPRPTLLTLTHRTPRFVQEILLLRPGWLLTTESVSQGVGWEGGAGEAEACLLFLKESPDMSEGWDWLPSHEIATGNLLFMWGRVQGITKVG